MDMTSHMERVYCQDYRRLGMPVGGAIGPRHRVHRWRLSLVNSDYAVCKRCVTFLHLDVRHVSLCNSTSFSTCNRTYAIDVLRVLM